MVSTNNFSSELDALRDVLERLDYMAMDKLREFMASQDPKDREMEKRIHRARRAIMKAIGVLDSPTVEL